MMQGNHIVKHQYILIPVPLNDMIESGIDLDGVIQTHTADGKIIVENVPTEETGFNCDGDCDNCPFLNPDCEEDEECFDCPCFCPECGECVRKVSIEEGDTDHEENISGSR